MENGPPGTAARAVGSALSAACELGSGPQTSPATSLRPSDHMVRQYHPAGSSHQTGLPPLSPKFLPPPHTR